MRLRAFCKATLRDRSVSVGAALEISAGLDERSEDGGEGQAHPPRSLADQFGGLQRTCSSEPAISSSAVWEAGSGSSQRSRFSRASSSRQGSSSNHTDGTHFAALVGIARTRGEYRSSYRRPDELLVILLRICKALASILSSSFFNCIIFSHDLR